MNKNLLALFFTTIAFLFILFGFLGPWYNFHLEARSSIIEDNINYEIDLFLSRATFKGEIFGKSISKTYDYEKVTQIVTQIPNNSGRSSINQVIGIYDTTKIIVLVTLLISFITFIGYATSFLFICNSNSLKNLNTIMGSLFPVLSICTVIYFMISWDNAIQRGMSMFFSLIESIPIPHQIADMGFWYSFNQDGGMISMGPGLAWYMMIIGSIFGFTSIFLYSKTVLYERGKK